MPYAVPSIAEVLDIPGIARRALGLYHAVKPIGNDAWSVNGHVVKWDGAGFVCGCTNWEMYNGRQHGLCKHALAVCLRSDQYRAEVIAALEEVEGAEGSS